MRNYSQKFVNYFAYFVKGNMPCRVNCYAQYCSNEFLNLSKGLSMRRKERRWFFLEKGSSIRRSILAP
jgi:hypothetical protein